MMLLILKTKFRDLKINEDTKFHQRFKRHHDFTSLYLKYDRIISYSIIGMSLIPGDYRVSVALQNECNCGISVYQIQQLSWCPLR